MEKKSKKTIIIGITCLLLVTLILLGLTYAYYRTRIIGNDAETSISVTSKKMEVTYEDGTATLSTEGKIEPGFIASKTFYVTNTGDQSATYSIVLEDMNNTFERNQDWTYTLTENGTQISSGTIAVGRHQVLVGSTTIAETTGTKNTYVLTITYINSEEDQSEDMGQSLSFKVNIGEEQYTWENAPEGSLLYALKNNQPTGTEETIPGQSSSTENEARILTTEDDYGTSYVYRGNVTNNYVTYSNMCWRIVRIQGDGTIKLVLADDDNACGTANGYISANTLSGIIYEGDPTYRTAYSTGTLSINSFYYETSNIPAILETWSQRSNYQLDASKLVSTEWCNDLSISTKYGTNNDYYNFGATDRLTTNNGNRVNPNANPTLKCNMNGLDNSKAIRYENNIGILSADELAFAGLTIGGTHAISYLDANTTDLNYWSMSPFGRYDGGPIYFMMHAMNFNSTAYGLQWADGALTNVFGIRPSIVLNNNVLLNTEIAGQNGTIDTPYVIS